MPRITCDQPASKSITIRGANLPASATVVTEAPDFSIPDPADAAAQIVVPGEVWFGTPLHLHNKTGTQRTVTVSILTEAGSTVALGTVPVPAGETVAFPLQGQALQKRSAAAVNGDRLQLQASAANAIDFWATAYERRAQDHIGVSA